MPRPKITQHVRFTKATAVRNANMLRALKYMGEHGLSSSEDVAVYLDISTTTGRKFVTDFLELGLIEFSRYDTSHVTTGLGVKTYKVVDGAYERARELLPTEWEGQYVAPVIPCPEGQHLMADDFRTPQKLTVVKPFRDPLVACVHGWGRAPSLNFMDSANGG